ncbi:MAG TPA: hypothetical protein VM537_13930 [Anaerolineae bacterium]|nr:hypothetical protein [Anaerolineae bacterium]
MPRTREGWISVRPPSEMLVFIDELREVMTARLGKRQSRNDVVCLLLKRGKDATMGQARE